MFRVLLVVTLLFSCTKEEVYVYSREPNNNYNRYQTPYINPYSRYQNPYDIYQGNRGYPPYYDQDHYYVPPSNYFNNEPLTQFNGADVKH